MLLRLWLVLGLGRNTGLMASEFAGTAGDGNVVGLGCLLLLDGWHELPPF